jgi:hypothetical protein
MFNRQMAIVVSIFLFIIGATIMMSCLVWRGNPPAGQMMNQPVPAQSDKLNVNSTVIGHITAHRLDADGLMLMVCTDRFCHNVKITNKSEIIVTKLNGHRELNHSYESVAEILSKTKECNAAVGINGGNVEMVIIYLPE